MDEDEGIQKSHYIAEFFLDILKIFLLLYCRSKFGKTNKLAKNDQKQKDLNAKDVRVFFSISIVLEKQSHRKLALKGRQIRSTNLLELCFL